MVQRLVLFADITEGDLFSSAVATDTCILVLF